MYRNETESESNLLNHKQEDVSLRKDFDIGIPRSRSEYTIPKLSCHQQKIGAC